MVFPFLPAQHIQLMFIRIESLVPPYGKMCELIVYICQPRIEQCITSLFVSAIIGQGYFGMFSFTLPLVPECLYAIQADISISSWENPS